MQQPGQPDVGQPVVGHAQKIGKGHGKNGYVDAVGVGVFVCFFEQRKRHQRVNVARKAFDNVAHQRARKGKIKRAASGGFEKVFHILVGVFINPVGGLKFYGKWNIWLGSRRIFVA